jgi:hypothetical protein
VCRPGCQRRPVVACAIDDEAGEIRTLRLPPKTQQVADWIMGVPGPGGVSHEAGRRGFGLARTVDAAGVRCVVVATSKLEHPPGDKVRTDRRDAARQARQLRIGELPGFGCRPRPRKPPRDLVRVGETPEPCHERTPTTAPRIARTCGVPPAPNSAPRRSADEREDRTLPVHPGRPLGLLRLYLSQSQRRKALRRSSTSTTTTDPHAALGCRPPITRLTNLSQGSTANLVVHTAVVDLLAVVVVVRFRRRGVRDRPVCCSTGCSAGLDGTGGPG